MIFFKKTEIRKTTEKQNKNQNEKLISVIVMGRFQEDDKNDFFFLESRTVESTRSNCQTSLYHKKKKNQNILLLISFSFF
jgi:hypothetical protein